MFALSPNYFSSENCLEAWEVYSQWIQQTTYASSTEHGQDPQKNDIIFKIEKEDEGMNKRERKKAQNHLN